MSAHLCSFCVLDTETPGLGFDAEGRCSACREAEARLPHEWWRGAEGEARMSAMVAQLKEAGRGKPYDAMVGLSGGIDSAWLAHLMHGRGLRLLAVHVDGGWNSEPAVRNIESLVRTLDLDLHTHVVEWSEMRDVQLAFLRAGVINQDIPQDHAFFATLYRMAARFGIAHFLSGVNYATENVVGGPGTGFPSMDGAHVRAIHKRFGTAPLGSYPIMTLPEFVWRKRVLGSLKVLKPLNFVDYRKPEAKEELTRLYGWRDYGEKHGESRFTKFYQDIYLPRKFGYDKRRLHLSSLIVSGQLSRTEALQVLEASVMDPREEQRTIRFVARKLGIAARELEQLIDSPPVAHDAYPSHGRLHRTLTRARSLLRTASL